MRDDGLLARKMAIARSIAGSWPRFGGTGVRGSRRRIGDRADANATGQDQHNNPPEPELGRGGLGSCPPGPQARVEPPDAGRDGTASNYSAGDTVIFTRQYEMLGVNKGHLHEVVRDRLRAPHGWIAVEEILWRGGRIRPWGAKVSAEVHGSERMEIRADDRVRWRRNDSVMEVVDGGSGVLESTEKACIRVSMANGKAEGHRSELGNREVGLRKRAAYPPNSSTWTQRSPPCRRRRRHPSAQEPRRQ